jgi:hypothetical protein
MRDEQRVRSVGRGDALCVLLAGAVLLRSSPVHAGYDSVEAMREISSMRMTHHIQKLQLKQLLKRRHGDWEAKRIVVHKPLSATDFRPPRPGHPIADALVASVRDADSRKQLATAVSAAFAIFAKERANNVATALAAAVGMARAVADGETMSDDALDSLRHEINDALTVAPAYRKLGASEKQALYEYLVVNTTILALAFEAGKTDPAARASGMKLAQALLGGLEGSPAPSD